MSDIFRIDSSDNIKLTGGAQNEGICTHIDTREVRTKTELESGAQNAGGNDSTPDEGGISSVYVEGCLTGSGTATLPISIVLNPTGGIACGDDGLFITNVVVVTGVSATSITTSGCLSGSGTPADPTYVRINPTGGIQCTLAGLALQHTYLISVSTSGNPLSGNGTAASPLGVLINPTGKIHVTALGLALQDTYLTQATTSGCVSGSGTVVSPITLSLNPTGGLHCTPGGLAIQTLGTTGINVSSSCLSGVGTSASPLTLLFNPTGKIHCTAAGIALQEIYLTQAITSGCIAGIGTAGSPIVLTLSPTGGLQCTAGGLALQTLTNGTVPTGCLTGSGTTASPLALLLNPTGGLHCTPNGLAINATIASTVVSSGCVTGSGTAGSPIALLINPTGKINCTPAGLALQETYLTSTVTSGCVTGSGTALSPVSLSLNPTGGLQCTAGGLAVQFPQAAVTVSGCLSGSGTPNNPIVLTISPTGGLVCSVNGLSLSDALLGSGISSVTTTGCFSGQGTPASPLTLLINPTGKIHCTAAGIALQEVYLTQAITSGCIGGIGSAGSPIILNINPTGGLHCTPGGLALQTLMNGVVPTGCLSGSGTLASPLTITLNPTGKIQCTAAGLALQETYLTQAISSGCLSGVGTPASPIVLTVSPTGGLRCAADGLALQTLVSTVVPTGCLTGSGTLASPLSILVSPTGGLQCTSTGLALVSSGVATFGCISGNGMSVSPISLLVNPTGKIQCTAAGIALQEVYLTQVITSGCITGIGTVGSPVILSINPTGGLHCTPGGLAINMPLSNTGIVCYAYSYETGSAPGGPSSPTTPAANPSSGNIQVEVYDNVIRFWMFNGTGYTLDKEFSGGGGGTPASPSGSIQFNGGSAFSGSSSLTWDGSTLNVTGTIKTRNITNTVFAIPDGASVVLNPNSGSIQTWTLGSNRTPSGNFAEGQAITLMVDDGAGNTIDWSVINPVWLDGITPTLPTSGYGVFELWKVGSTIYGASLTSGTITGGSGSPGGSNAQIQFNNAGSFGGSSRLTWDGTTVGVSGAVNISGSTLTSDSVNLLAQRNSTTAQAFRVYNTFTTTGNYERATIDWAGSPGVLQIGTQHAGAGTAKGVQLITSGTPRIDISAAGSIQFNSAYTFPTLDGVSGQVLSTNGVGVLRFVNQSGGGGTPASPSGSIQFNGGGTFAGTSNLMWDGSVLGVTGTVNTKNVSNLVYTIVDGLSVDINPANGGIQIWTLGDNRTPTASSFNQGQAVTLMIEDGSTYSVDWSTMGVSWLGGFEPQLPTTGYGVIELWKVGSTIYGASSNTASGVSVGTPVNSIQFNSGGNFAGSSGLTWSNSTLAISGQVNISGSLLASDAVNVLAQRNSTNAQALRIYNTFTNSSNYERGIFDWAGSPGVLQIGTQHAGTGTAKNIQIVTSGTPRIDIAAAGAIQFYGAYTFPTGVGSSGQALVTNGAGTLNWVNVSGAGGGTPASPSSSVQFNNGGSFGGSSNFTWSGSGLNVTGIVTANNVTSAVYAIVDSSSVDINPASGAIQTWTLGAVRTPTATNFTAGQAVTLMVDDGASYTINWSSINPTWIGGAPTLAATGYNVIELWKVGSTIYGAGVTSNDYFTGETNDGNSSTGIVIDFSTRANHKLTLTNNCTLTFVPPSDARQTLIRFVQGGSGGYSVNLPSGTLGDALVLPTGVGSQSVVRFYYDGDGSFHV